MSEAPRSDDRPSDDRPSAGKARQRSQRDPSLSALEEALREALETASREQVLHRVMNVLPTRPRTDSGPAEAGPSGSGTAETGTGESETGPKPGLHGKVQKVSVSMPAELIEAVRARTGAGVFSRYVTDAVQERLRLDLLDDLSADLTAAYGPVDEEQVRQAMAEWPDYPHR